MKKSDFVDPEFDAAVSASGIVFSRWPLSRYVAALRAGRTFSLARYGDGELACMAGEAGANCDGDPYSEALGNDLRYSLSRADRDFLYGMQRVLPQDVVRFRDVRDPGRPWVDSEVFGRALLAGELYPFVKQLRGMQTVFVGSIPEPEVKSLLGCRRVIETPPRGAYQVKNQVVSHIAHEGFQGAYLFSCGLSAKCMVAELHGRVANSWFLDLGHLWDVFVGRVSRVELREVTPEIIRRNLEGC